MTYPSNPAHAALLRAVASAIVDCGYAAYADKRLGPHADRSAHIAEIAADARLHVRSRRVSATLLDDIMLRYGVTRSNAGRLLGQARRRAKQ